MSEIPTEIFLTFKVIPPSSNNQYLIVRRGGRTLHIPSQELTSFKKQILDYRVEMPAHLAKCLDLMEQWTLQRKLLEIQTLFYFKKDRLFTQDERPKKLDCSNRIKAIHDSVSNLLGIDDSLFFKVFAQKIPLAKYEKLERTEVTVKPVCSVLRDSQ